MRPPAAAAARDDVLTEDFLALLIDDLHHQVREQVTVVIELQQQPSRFLLIERDGRTLDVAVVAGRDVQPQRLPPATDDELIDGGGSARHAEEVIPVAPDVITRSEEPQRFAVKPPANGLAVLAQRLETRVGDKGVRRRVLGTK